VGKLAAFNKICNPILADCRRIGIKVKHRKNESRPISRNAAFPRHNPELCKITKRNKEKRGEEVLLDKKALCVYNTYVKGKICKPVENHRIKFSEDGFVGFFNNHFSEEQDFGK